MVAWGMWIQYLKFNDQQQAAQFFALKCTQRFDQAAIDTVRFVVKKSVTLPSQTRVKC